MGENVQFRFYSSGLLRCDAIIEPRECGAREKPMSSAAAKKPRPKYLSLSALLFEIRMPPSAWVSGFHRISGFLLFLPFTAWLLYLLDASLASEQGFRHVRESYLASPIAKLAILVFAWAFLHHFCAGIRFLLLDQFDLVGIAGQFGLQNVRLARPHLLHWRRAEVHRRIGGGRRGMYGFVRLAGRPLG